MVLPFFVSLIGLESEVRAQQSINTAMLSGFVEDSNGASVSGASVSVTAIERNQSAVGQTDEQGRFRFSYLPVGAYKLVIKANGFATREQTLVLTVGQSLSLTINLPVASVAGGVEIVSEPPVVEVVRTQVAETILPREIDALPLNGRNYLDLAALTPGVTRGNPVANQRFAETSAVPGTQINIAGQRNINNGFVIDGLSANDDAADLPGTFLSQEVIGEFQVITSGGIAEFGRASGGIVNIVTRSGSNDWHGRMYGFLVNQHLNARNPLANARTPLTQAQYGASLGGPLRRDKGFIFSSFERTSLRSTTVLTISPANVASINTILDQLAYKGPRVSTGLAPTGYDANNLFVRGDYRLDDRNLLQVRYSLYDIDSPNARGVGGLNAISRGTSLANRDQTIAISEVASLGANIVNEARFQYTHSRLSAPPNDLTGPAINISGVANLGTSTSSPTGRANDLFELVDNLTIQRATHSVKFGVDLLYNRVNILFPGALQGVYTFSSLANLQAGRYATYQQAFGAPSLFQSNPNLGLFLQDEWRVRRDLTINAGIRYDLQDLPDPIQTDRNNFAPRLGLAYAPGSGRTVIRASYGLFFDRIPLRTTSNALQRDGTKYKVATFAFGQAGAPQFPNVAAAFPTGFLPSITTIDPQIGNAYSLQTSLHIERELSAATSLAVGYIRTRGLHLVLARNVNVPTLSAAEATRLGVANLGRPNPAFGNISRYESSGDSWYNGLTVSLNRRFRGWAGMRLSYT
ncbi:MAG: carboxypeptidase regulatory-like domain-containing protein, partial [Acidobacteriota bacterium]